MKLHLATGNPHKVEEVQEALAETGVSVEQAQMDLNEIDAEDVEDVARQKVIDAFNTIDVREPVIVDDTGLYVDALNGFPGSHAGFFLDRCGVNGLLDLMKSQSGRHAYFKTAIAIYEPEVGETTIVTGRCDGRITKEPRGNDGFGYDSVFQPEGHDKSFAEDIDHKMQVSHRRKVIDKLVDWVQNRSE